MVDWQPYLESICERYAQWWRVYTFTDVVGRTRDGPDASEPEIPFMDLGLIAQMIVQKEPDARDDEAADVEAADEDKQPKEKIERFSVLHGLRKYAAEHVLLVGRPGSGKSTSLLRLLIEEAQALQQAEVEREALGIPVLLELRYFQASIEDLIRNFLKQHKRLLEYTKIEQLLFEGQLLLLIDGVNELPSEEARRKLRVFHQTYGKTPMVFTTRELSSGGNLGIEKKLEMQPLSEPQMRQFVNGYLPGQGEVLLKQLQERLRSLGQTPLLLWMLCSLFRQTGEVPQNLGLVFRQFTHSYEKSLRSDVPVSEVSRRWWPELLKQLAYTMTEGDSLTEIKVAIERSAAEACLAEFLESKKSDRPWDRAKEYLQDLLNHHLIQPGAEETIEFRHQLIQEYYTAEWLLERLEEISDAGLQRHYLNYLKWTESFKVVLSLLSSKAKAERIIKIAVETDWQLGAKLISNAKYSWHKELIQEYLTMQCSIAVKAWLLSLSNPRLAKSILAQQVKQENAENHLGYEKEHLFKEVNLSQAKNKIEGKSGLRREGFYEDYVDFFEENEEGLSYGDTLSETVSNIYSNDFERDTFEKIYHILGDDYSRYTLEVDYSFMFEAGFLEDLSGTIKAQKDNSNTESWISEKDAFWLERLLQDGSYAPGAWAVNYIAKLSDEMKTDKIYLLIQALKSANPNVRMLAANELGRIAEPKVLTILYEEFLSRVSEVLIANDSRQYPSGDEDPWDEIFYTINLIQERCQFYNSEVHLRYLAFIENSFEENTTVSIETFKNIDFAILTAIEPERLALCQALNITPTHRIRKDTRTYWQANLPLPNGQHYNLILAQASDMANVDAALLAADTINHWQPQAILMVGIAAAADPKQSLGDLVLGKDIYYYDRGKVTAEGTLPEPIMYRPDATLWNCVTTTDTTGFDILAIRPDGTDIFPRVYPGIIASGERVIAHAAARDDIVKGHRKIKAIEMEGYGVSAAAWQRFEPVRCLVIRALCDYADGEKNDVWHEYAAAVAAGFIKHFLLDMPLPPLG
jgi:nucleoside phosphorylase